MSAISARLVRFPRQPALGPRGHRPLPHVFRCAGTPGLPAMASPPLLAARHGKLRV